MFFYKTRPYTGIEIAQNHILAALLSKIGNSWVLNRYSKSSEFKHTLKPSFKAENILNPEQFRKELEKVLQDCRTHKGNINVSLPNEVVKIVVRQFEGLPRDNREKAERIRWSVSKDLGFPLDELRVSWNEMGTDSSGRSVLLVAMASDSVLSQYESEIKQVGVVPRVLSPTGLNQFNCYSSIIPDKGRIAYIGLFEEFIILFVFEDGLPRFYKTLKKNFLNKKNMKIYDKVDVVHQYYMKESPDLTIEKYFIAPHHQSKDFLNSQTDTGEIEFVFLNETDCMEIGKNAGSQSTIGELSLFVGAAGAAKSGAVYRRQKVICP